MKKLFPIVAALVISAQAAFSQGTVNFANTGAFATTADRFVYQGQVGGPKLVGSSYVAALYYGTSDSTITTFAIRSTAVGDETLARSVVAFRDVDPATASAGTWVGGIRTMLGTTTGQALKLQIRVWDISKFANYDLAVAGGGAVGHSDIFDYTVAAPTDAAGLKINNMRAFAVVPEPSTIALGVIGLGSLLLFRRRK
jgi:hypothetical protein